MDAGSIKVLEEKKSWKKLDFCSLTWKAFRSCKGASKTRAHKDVHLKMLKAMS